jgi:hypothetical protein
MVWSQADLELESEDNRQAIYGRYARLTCQDCHATVDATTLLLTRQQMVQQPPDILFTTTEMLNRRLSNAGERHLFGVGAVRPPRLVLMDEIHLNEGIHGAQVAYLLRRWRHLRRQQTQQGVCIVGLSATLTQADLFFARLTGIPVAHVSYISPADGDLVKEGLEYNVVLKGDPVSGTTLLSTSVRTAMLICRILDPLQAGAEEGVSGGAYGQRVFAFSDKLDVINRWYHIEREVENPVKPYSQYLLVDRTARDAQARYEQGQNWYFVPAIHNDPTILTSGSAPGYYFISVWGGGQPGEPGCCQQHAGGWLQRPNGWRHHPTQDAVHAGCLHPTQGAGRSHTQHASVDRADCLGLRA